MQDTEQVTSMADMFSAYVHDVFGLVVDVPDQDTGEMIPTPIARLAPERALVGIGFAIQSHLKDQELQLQTLKEQMAILASRADMVREIIDRQVAALKDRATLLLSQLNDQGKVPTDKQRRPYFKIAGCGKFTVQLVSRDTVDSSIFDKLDDEAKTVIRQANADCFVIKTQVNADKRVILAELKAGKAIDGFMLTPAATGLVFKPETKTGIADDATTIVTEGEN